MILDFLSENIYGILSFEMERCDIISSIMIVPRKQTKLLRFPGNISRIHHYNHKFYPKICFYNFWAKRAEEDVLGLFPHCI